MIRHLLYACPICKLVGGVRAARKRDACIGCGTEFSRAAGSRVRARRPGAADVVMPAAEWVDRLAPLDEIRFGPGSPPAEPVTMREAIGKRPVRSADRALAGWVDRFGPDRRGTIALENHRLLFRGPPDPPRTVPLLEVTGIQASSNALLIKQRSRPVVAFRFTAASLRLWEHAIQSRIRERYAEEGLGEIIEFQPKICVRR